MFVLLVKGSNLLLGVTSDGVERNRCVQLHVKCWSGRKREKFIDFFRVLLSGNIFDMQNGIACRWERANLNAKGVLEAGGPICLEVYHNFGRQSICLVRQLNLCLSRDRNECLILIWNKPFGLPPNIKFIIKVYSSVNLVIWQAAGLARINKHPAVSFAPMKLYLLG